MSLALARKYRPRTFGDVAVQSHVANTLRGAVARGRVAHGYLLCGPRGVGKTTLARVLAMALNCENRQPDGEPCGTCTSCNRIWSGSSSLDVVEIDAASNRGVDDARELRERAMYAPSGEHGYKVYIVDEAHMLTREAWNALLKVLEEPPPRVVFVFATTEPQKIAQAAAPVLSRLQRFDFKRMGAGDIRQRLEAILASEQVDAEPEALLMIARAADGSMRDALSLTDQVLSMDEGAITAARVREALGFVAEDEFLAVLDIVAERRAGDVFAFVARLADAGVDFGIFLTGLGDMLRAQLAVTLGGAAPDVSEAARRALAERASRLAAGDLLRMLSALAELEPMYRQSGQQQMLIEMLLVRFALMDRTVELSELLGALGPGSGEATGGGGRGGSGGPTPARERTQASGSRASSSASRPSSSRDASGAAAASPTHKAAPASPPAAVRATQVERPVSLPDPPPVLADASPSAAPRPVPLELARVAERWDELVERLRAAGQPVVADALQNAAPASVSAANGGVLAIAQRTPNPFHARAIQERSADVLAVLQGWFAGVARISVSSEPSTAPPRRLTDEMLRSERLARLRQQNPLLGTAIDVLDLDVAD
ncbi:MAG TPA: DNA polymerase III subunit gamma/tau [Gemmatimonadaceae bacterium]|nr:DNA polymerase III subunit gamma/tau [Gemmatimonadaceae bacterium]